MLRRLLATPLARSRQFRARIPWASTGPRDRRQGKPHAAGHGFGPGPRRDEGASGGNEGDHQRAQATPAKFRRSTPDVIPGVLVTRQTHRNKIARRVRAGSRSTVHFPRAWPQSLAAPLAGQVIVAARAHALALPPGATVEGAPSFHPDIHFLACQRKAPGRSIHYKILRVSESCQSGESWS